MKKICSETETEKIKELRMNVTEVLAHLTVSIDFSEEDVEEITYQTLEEKSSELRNEIKKLYETDIPIFPQRNWKPVMHRFWN